MSKRLIGLMDLRAVEADRLMQLPLKGLQKEYPNKLSHTLNSPADLRGPKTLHPAFYGCFDWHSSVHGHWLLVNLLRHFSDLNGEREARRILSENISAENILQEVAYFNSAGNRSFERTYGWAWLLKLAEELHLWEDDLAPNLLKSLSPLVDLIVERYLEFLPKLVYPLRNGTHSNTAFGLSFAFDYAEYTGHAELKTAIVAAARNFFWKDRNGPINWEPNGYDFFSPVLQELELMRKILDRSDVLYWIEGFLPQLFDENFDWETAEVSDRSDGLLVHLDGLNFSRAWCLWNLASDFSQFEHLRKLAEKHFQYSIDKIVDGDYMGEHWLATFAVYALNSKSRRLIA